jgi:hypothetical protein
MGEPGRDEPMGGEAACFLDRVRDCCGRVEGEPHRPDCAEAKRGLVSDFGRDANQA